MRNLFREGVPAKGSVIVIDRDLDGEWPEWAFEAAGHKLEFVGGTDQWKNASYRMGYLRVVLDALGEAYDLRIQ